ncbi:MAG: zinc-ribbon domain-containing protein [Lachnospiraceae bacterium]|nr:zinc-ribbon domain-containing protein [Lachnospiraceae bacterium]
MIYCTQCGNENEETSKFCRNCGARLQSPNTQEPDKQEDVVLSSEETMPVYEKITDAEEQKPAPVLSQDEITINSYSGSEQQNNSNSSSANTNPYYDVQSPQYYSSNQNETMQGGGHIGVAIASLVCGILSIICCCFSLFSGALAVAAVVLGIITLCAKYDGKGMAIAGIITGGIGFLIVIAMLVIGGSAAYNDLLDEFYYDYFY